VTPPPPLFRLADLTDEKTVYLVQREAVAEALWARKLPATFVGLGHWRPDYVTQLQTAGVKNLVVLPEHSPAGATQGRQVADACARAGLQVKLVPLPNLPPSGDVRDYFATHSRAAFGQLVREVPLHDPTRPVAAAPPLVLESLADLLASPDEAVAYVVEDRIPVGSVVLFCAPPKTGKSTATRSLALAVARGAPWLGWRTTAGPVWYFAFEDKREEVKKHFRLMGGHAGDAVQVVITHVVPPTFLRDLHARAVAERPRLIIIDHLGHVLGAKDYNDYAQVVAKFAPILAIARDSGATVVLNYHASSHQAREGVDAVLGSTGIGGSVDNLFIYRTDPKDPGVRLLHTVQRIGDNLPATVIALDKATGWLQRGAAKHVRDSHALGDAILAVLRSATEPLTEPDLLGQVEGRRTSKEVALRRLVGLRWVRREGEGKKGFPYRYAASYLAPDGPFREGAEGAEGAEGPLESGGAEGESEKPVVSGTSTYRSSKKDTEELRSSAAAAAKSSLPGFDPKGWKH
jgi:hypothetical protein